MYVKASVDETDIGKVEKDQEVRVVADALPEDTYFGKVLRIAPLAKVEQNVTTFEVTTEVDNPQIQLKAGMNATVEIILAEKRNVLLLPNEALYDPRALRSYFGQSPTIPDSVRQHRRSSRRPLSLEQAIRLPCRHQDHSSNHRRRCSDRS